MINHRSVFDIIELAMIGPSSSHITGVVTTRNATHLIFQKTPKKVIVHYCESFAKTRRDHGTDFAIAGGLLGIVPDDEQIPNAPKLLTEAGTKLRSVEEDGPNPINHPNATIVSMLNDEKQVIADGYSIDGRIIEIRLIEF